MVKVVCLEGINGTGKSYTLSRLYEYMNFIGVEHLGYIEPSNDTNLGNSVRELIRRVPADPKYAISNFSRLMLFLASRRETTVAIKNKIKLFDERGKNAILFLDRYTLSTLTYNFYETDYNLEWLYQLEHEAREGFLPDVTYILNRNTSDCIEALKARGERNIDIKKLHTLHDNYRSSSKYVKIKEPDFNYQFIDNHDKDSGFNLIIENMKKEGIINE